MPQQSGLSTQLHIRASSRDFKNAVDEVLCSLENASFLMYSFGSGCYVCEPPSNKFRWSQ